MIHRLRSQSGLSVAVDPPLAFETMEGRIQDALLQLVP